jgi:PBSX family phage terminase large subunit
MQEPLAPKQVEFILNSTKRWNLAHGAVRTGKTVCTAFRFMQAVNDCPDSKIFIVGHTFDTAYRNVVRLLMESPELSIFRPFLSWSGKKLYFRDKVITVLGAKDEGAIGQFQGDTYSLVYCDEMTLYPTSIIEMINSRLSKSYSMGFAAMNPKHPSHILKQWIDLAEAGDPKYYSLHFNIDDNPFIDESYKQSLRDCGSSIFYKRNYLGLWCVGEGSIFDFFDRDTYLVERPPTAAEYWIAGIDYGTTNPFCCLIIGVSTGKYSQEGVQMWVEKEYYYDQSKKGRAKTSSEFAREMKEFLEPYAVQKIYVDPSAANFKLDLQRLGMHPIDANNDVYNGIQKLSSDLQTGKLLICSECKNLVREVESYVWDQKKSERGYDEPLKKDDHAVDALRYAIASHKVNQYWKYNPGDNNDYLNNRFSPTRRF